ncbi:MAG: long-chain fatty acid--CoA ligase [Flavobacteriales bacterium]|nr:long-chain fatty acid--CoA ligase [Flavobacteriales bacterium]
MKEPKRLFDFPYYQLENFPLEKMMTSRLNGEWTTISTVDFVKQMNLVSRGLISLGIAPGDRVALITHANRMEWDIMDNGIMQIGAIDVPIYPTMTEQDCEYIMNHAETRLCFVSNKELYDKISGIKSKIPSLLKIYTFERVEGAPHWSELFSVATTTDPSKVDELSRQVKEEDLATIIYTSGTTGLPKGVMLSHRNIASNAIDCEERLPHLVKGESRCLTFLPISHIYERMLHYLYIANGVHMYMSGMDSIKDDLAVAKPHMFTGVPRLFEKFYDGIYAKGMANTGIKKVLFKWAHDLALQWEPEGANGWWYEFKLGIARKLVFSKVKEALGLTEISGIASGSAALQVRLARFFNGASIWIKEGYGLTETSPVISVNTFRRPNMWRAGTVGKPIKNVEVKIAEDGEILCKGPNVMIGYYKDKEKTDEVLKDGWFHTGDIGQIEDGFLKITDRKKELFKTSGGKYVAPQVLENAMKESVYIEQIVVIGDGEKFPAALIVPEMVGLKVWAQKQGVDSSNIEAMLAHQKVQTLFDGEIERINVRFGNWEQVKAFRLLPRQLTIDAGEITPTLKLKRKKILENWKNLIDDIYRRND